MGSNDLPPYAPKAMLRKPPSDGLRHTAPDGGRPTGHEAADRTHRDATVRDVPPYDGPACGPGCGAGGEDDGGWDGGEGGAWVLGGCVGGCGGADGLPGG
ncbi:hypothetical protein [Streptomyces sp. C36]|uniref:hypothetical protein n=1 Tax=Streptomyces sp. C36 TaxID=3237122 RepID=UPI0034C61680